MKMFKRILALAIAALMAFALVACDKDKSASSSKAGSSKAASSSSSKAGSKDSTSSDATSSDSKPAVVEAAYRDSSYNKKVKNLKILPVGDSLCEGQAALSGWRYPLFEQLYSKGVTFEFVGPFDTTRDYRLTERYSKHGSKSGRTVNDVLNDFGTIFGRDFDVVVMMIGYNDQNDLTGAYDKYDKLVNKIFIKNPNAVVFLTGVAPDKGGDARFSEYNNHVKNLCETLTKSGKKAYFVPMNTKSLDKGLDYGDWVHFNERGNRTVASMMADVMTDVLLKMNTPDNSYTLPVSPSGITLDKTKVELTVSPNINQAVTLNPTVSPDNAAIKNVTYMTDDSRVATVDNYGRITAKGVGTCTVTAKTLDGGKAATCTVTVKNSGEKEATKVFSDSFASKDKWTGGTDAIGDGFITTWKNCTRAYVIESKDDVNAGDNFAVSMTYFLYRSEGDRMTRNFVSAKLGDLEVRVKDFKTAIELYCGDQLIGSYNLKHYSVETDTFTLRYNKGQASVLMSGETVISAKCSPSSVSGKLTITNVEIGRAVTMPYVEVIKY